jgi:hypothetical protein
MSNSSRFPITTHDEQRQWYEQYLAAQEESDCCPICDGRKARKARCCDQRKAGIAVACGEAVHHG